MHMDASGCNVSFLVSDAKCLFNGLHLGLLLFVEMGFFYAAMRGFDCGVDAAGLAEQLVSFALHVVQCW